MEGPERLEDDARGRRRGTWVVAGAVVVVLVGLAGVRLTGVLPEPSPPTPTSTPLPRPGWPKGVGSGTLYALDAAGVATIDVGSGLVSRSALRVDPDLVALTAGGPGVVVWFFDDDGTPHLVTAGSSQTPVVGPVLAQGRQFLPGSGTAVWTSRDDGTSESRSVRWRLVDTDDAVGATVRLAGQVRSDGSGGLFATEGDRVRHVVVGRAETGWSGSVGAAGPDGYEVQQCIGVQCSSVLHERANGTDEPVDTVTTDDGDGAVLSPGNRFSAAVRRSDDAGPLLVRVSGAGQRQALRSWPTSEDGATPLAWLSDRWLASTGTEGLVLYDAVDDVLVVPGEGLTGPTQLVFRPA